MERKWLEGAGTVDEAALDVQHFSATTDLYQLTSNVYQIKGVPLDLQDLIAERFRRIVAVSAHFALEILLNEIIPDLVKLLL